MFGGEAKYVKNNERKKERKKEIYTYIGEHLILRVLNMYRATARLLIK